MILFILCFQNLSKQTTATKKNQAKKKRGKKGKEFFFFVSQRSNELLFIYLFIDSFSPADLSAGADVQEMFHSLALVWEEQQAEHRAQGVCSSLGSPAQHRARPLAKEPKGGQGMEKCPVGDTLSTG